MVPSSFGTEDVGDCWLEAGETALLEEGAEEGVGPPLQADRAKTETAQAIAARRMKEPP
jgi:hypothetical protein